MNFQNADVGSAMVLGTIERGFDSRLAHHRPGRSNTNTSTTPVHFH